MIKKIAFADVEGTQRELVLSDSASLVIRYEEAFRQPLMGVLAGFPKGEKEGEELPSNVPADIGLRLAYAMARPRPEEPYVDWVDNIPFSEIEKITEGAMELLMPEEKTEAVLPEGEQQIKNL